MSPKLLVFFLLFVASGFSGLIYESLWTHYLKLFLGHASYAQTLVLAIFMGGMASGSWLAGRKSEKIANPILAYALIEILIGVLGLTFHSTYGMVTGFAYSSIIPSLNSPALIVAFKWGLSLLLIFPPSILLGTTFPLLSSGLYRECPERPGYLLGWLYFTNSIGAAMGVLASGFVLIPTYGLPGALLCAGSINILVGVLAWLFRKSSSEIIAVEQEVPKPAAVAAPLTVLLLCSCFTGVASFFYEIAWIRMLSLVLGSSTHSFEVMLSAFITGLALGGFWIRGRIEKTGDLIVLLGRIQLLMGLAALLTLPLYDEVFQLMAFFVNALKATEEGYSLFILCTHFISLCVMLPATVCAGMTLPLITATLLRSEHGEQIIGKVYAVNTLGAILGVIVGAQVILPLLGLKALVMSGVIVDVGLAMLLLYPTISSAGIMQRAIVGLSVVLICLVGWVVEFKPARLASGVFRYGSTLVSGNFRYYQDGITASIGLRESKNNLVLTTNGKPLAGISKDEDPTEDESTMVLLGALPFIFNPDIKDVGIIGLGSGVTTATVLKKNGVEKVDTIEIEPAVAAASKAVGPLVEIVHTDPRSKIYFDDARTHFTTYSAQYDLIISEPSNPWVSGVAGLFSGEFYEHVVRHLRPEGILVQWFQVYEADTALLASVMKALTPHFDDYMIFVTSKGDVAIVAKLNGKFDRFADNAFTSQALLKALNRVNVRSLADIWSKRIGPKHILDPFFASFSIPANSDFFPVLEHEAIRSRFLSLSGSEFLELGPVSLGLEQAINPDKFRSQVNPELQRQALLMVDPEHAPPARSAAEALFKQGWFPEQCSPEILNEDWTESMHKVVRPLLRNSDVELVAQGLTQLRRLPCRSVLTRRQQMWLDWYATWGTKQWGQCVTSGLNLLTDKSILRKDAVVITEFVLLCTIRTRQEQYAVEVLKTLEKFRNLTLSTRLVFSWLEHSLAKAK